MRAVKFHNPVGNIVKKITVMRYHQQLALKLTDIIFQPDDHFIIQMVGRLV